MSGPPPGAEARREFHSQKGTRRFPGGGGLFPQLLRVSPLPLPNRPGSLRTRHRPTLTILAASFRTGDPIVAQARREEL